MEAQAAFAKVEEEEEEVVSEAHACDRSIISLFETAAHTTALLSVQI